MMGTYATGTFPTSNRQCLHMEGKGAPVCWDCAEAGHIYSPSSTEGEGLSPAWERPRRFQESPGFRDENMARSNIYPTEAQSVGLELRPAEDGLEVGVPGSRHSQPGLIVVTGPQVVSPQDKFRKPELEHHDWNSAGLYRQQQGETIISHPSPQKQEPDSYNYHHQEDKATLTREPVAREEKKEKQEKQEKEKILGLQRRTFWIILALIILGLIGLVVGVAVSVTQQNKALYVSSEDNKPHGESELIALSPTPSFVSSPTSDGGQVNGSGNGHTLTSPTTVTKTTPTHAVSDSSSPTALSDTNNIDPSSHQEDGGATSTGRGGEGGGGRGSGGGNRDSDFVTVTATPTIIDDAQRPSTTIVQPTTIIVSAPSSSPPPPPPPPQKTSPAAQAFPAPYSSRICFRDDGSTYTDPGTGSRFSVECGVAHEGKDIVNLEAETMEQCVNLCAKNKFCKGAIWFNVGPQGTDLNYCWLKSEMDDDVRETIDAQSVVRL